MNNPIMEDVLELTKTLIHEYCDGKYENWFSYLSKNSVFISTGEEILSGSKNIINHLTPYAKKVAEKSYMKNTLKYL